MKIAVMIPTGLLLTGCAANLPAPGRSYRCPDPQGCPDPDPAPQVYYRR